MFDIKKGKNQKIRHDLVKTADYLYRLADTLYDSEQIIDGKFKMKKDVRRIFNQAEKRIIPIIEEVTFNDIFRGFTKVTTKEILRKMRKYMFHLLKTEPRAEEEPMVEIEQT
ncbi:MAG: hypothetical protein GH145_04495 [Firmicutes bacterium]|nr:hypothetical protein [Bacillota bacterium]